MRLESRPPNVEGTGEIRIRDLFRNALRMRPDRIIIGECRGAEALDMLQAMNTGHDGSLTTIHANSQRDALSRIETMVLMAGFDLPVRAIREQIASALDLVVHTARLRDGSRKVIGVSEVVGMEGDIVTMQEIVRFAQRGVDKENKVLGEFCYTGVQPICLKRFARVRHSVRFARVERTDTACSRYGNRARPDRDLRGRLRDGRSSPSSPSGARSTSARRHEFTGLSERLDRAGITVRLARDRTQPSWPASRSSWISMVLMLHPKPLRLADSAADNCRTGAAFGFYVYVRLRTKRGSTHSSPNSSRRRASWPAACASGWACAKRWRS